MDTEDIDSVKRLLVAKKRRLAKLREQKALLGYGGDPKIDLEIEDIETEIKELQLLLSQKNLIEDQPATNIGPPIQRKSPSTNIKGTMVWIIGLAVMLLLMIALKIYFNPNRQQATPYVSPNTQPATPYLTSNSNAQPMIITTTAILVNSTSTSPYSSNIISNTLDVRQLLISESATRYRIEITLKNNIKLDTLVKRISILLSSHKLCPVFGRADAVTLVMSDTFTLKELGGNKLKFTGYLSYSDSDGYSYWFEGEIRKNRLCNDSALVLDFNTSFLLPANEYQSIYLLIPKSIRIMSDQQDLIATKRTIENSSLLMDFLHPGAFMDYGYVDVRVSTDSQRTPIDASFPVR